MLHYLLLTNILAKSYGLSGRDYIENAAKGQLKMGVETFSETSGNITKLT